MIGALLVALAAITIGGVVVRRNLPAPLCPCLGIDLGTTYSCIAAWDPSSRTVVVIGDENGRKTIPSMVSYVDPSSPVRSSSAAVKPDGPNGPGWFVGYDAGARSVIQ